MRAFTSPASFRGHVIPQANHISLVLGMGAVLLPALQTHSGRHSAIFRQSGITSGFAPTCALPSLGSFSLG